MRIIRYSPNLL